MRCLQEGNFVSDSLNLPQATDKLSAWDPLCTQAALRLYLLCPTGQRWLMRPFSPAFAVGFNLPLWK